VPQGAGFRKPGEPSLRQQKTSAKIFGKKVRLPNSTLVQGGEKSSTGCSSTSLRSASRSVIEHGE
jgi:hypothetical protein